MIKLVPLFFGFLLFLGTQHPKTPLSVGGMEVGWEHKKDHITFTATAPDNGWVALGFNTEDHIVGSNLIMINVTEEEVQSQDLFVVSAGNPKPMHTLGAKSQILAYSGVEKNGKTTITFSLPTKTIDDYHLNLSEGQKIWLICAYSMEDDFSHHSRMRKHIQVVL
ncbi:MAG: DOMON domain-containing protein [Bacteroidota bacterium]